MSKEELLQFEGLVTEILPDETAYYLSALNYFLTQHQTDAALGVWDHFLAPRNATRLSQAIPLLNELIAEQRLVDAVRIWKQSLAAASGPQNDAGNPSSPWRRPWRALLC